MSIFKQTTHQGAIFSVNGWEQQPTEGGDRSIPSSAHYELQSHDFASVGRKIVTLKPENRSPSTSGFRV